MASEAGQDVQQLVVFDVGDETYGVNIGTVREINRIQTITKLPNTPEYVEGVINLRGTVIPVVDLRSRFGLERLEHTKDTRIVVVDIDGQNIGVIVDAVTEVLYIPSESIEPPTAMIASADSDYLVGIVKLEERLISLLLLDRLFAGTKEASTEVNEAAAA